VLAQPADGVAPVSALAEPTDDDGGLDDAGSGGDAGGSAAPATTVAAASAPGTRAVNGDAEDLACLKPREVRLGACSFAARTDAAPPDRAAARQVHHRAGEREEGHQHRAAQPLASAAPA